jgi:hypothetical protein
MGRAVFDRLREQGDEVRVIEDDPIAAEAWKERGGYAALAREWDADLIERASFGARTIVIFERRDRNPEELLTETLKAAVPAGLDRVILIREKASVPASLEGSDVAYVILATGKRSLLKRAPTITPERLGRAVDAADDLAGTPRLALDLTEAAALRTLGLDD